MSSNEPDQSAPGAMYDATVLFDGTFTSPRLDHPESVAVAEDGAIWCGGERGQVFRIQDGRIEEVACTDGFILGVHFLDPDTLVLCDLAGPDVWLLDVESRELTRMQAPDGHELVSPNAAVGLPDGSFLVTDSGVAHQPRTGVLRYRRDGSAAVWLARPIDFANGMTRSPDGRTVYIAESWSHRILAVDVEGPDHHAGEVHVFADTGTAIPDGVCVDADGVVYVGCYEPSQVLCIPRAGDVRLLAHDPTAHTLCHPTGVAARDHDIVVSNLGRWHLSTVPRPAGIATST